MNKENKKSLRKGQAAYVVNHPVPTETGYEIIEGEVITKSKKYVGMKIPDVPYAVKFLLDEDNEPEFGLREKDYGLRVLCASRDEAEKYILKQQVCTKINSIKMFPYACTLNQLQRILEILEEEFCLNLK